MVSTQDVGMKFASGMKDGQKLSAAQSKQWSASVVGKMTQQIKTKSVNQVLWGDQQTQKKK